MDHRYFSDAYCKSISYNISIYKSIYVITEKGK